MKDIKVKKTNNTTLNLFLILKIQNVLLNLIFKHLNYERKQKKNSPSR